MGEIADDMISGISCSLCGVYFTEEHGYPVVCSDCWDDLNEKERKLHVKANQAYEEE